MRGLIKDLQIFESHYDEAEFMSRTSNCDNSQGEIFKWDVNRINIKQVG